MNSTKYSLNKIQTLKEITRKFGIKSTIPHLAYSLGIEKVQNYYINNVYNFKSQNYSPKPVKINPEEVKYNKKFPFPVSGQKAVIGIGEGNWDKMRIKYMCEDAYKGPLNSEPIYESMKMRFNEGKEWEETPKYKHSKHKIEKGGLGWNRSKNIQELKENCKKVEELYNDIKNNGYRPEKNIGKAVVSGITAPSEIRVAVSRNGELIRCEDGRHRLAIAKILGLEEIPAIIQIEHRKHDREFNPKKLTNYI